MFPRIGTLADYFKIKFRRGRLFERALINTKNKKGKKARILKEELQKEGSVSKH